jgi:hypothetical protein
VDTFLQAHFPIRVPRAYGWSHSPALTGDPELQRSFRNTPSDWPWITHAGEGVDAAAAGEFERLESLGCVSHNTLLVHGLAFDDARQRRAIDAGASLIWCPSSNVYLFGRTLDPARLLAAGRLGLGSDSRISGAGDLLDELRTAAECHPGCAPQLEQLVTRHNARLLRLDDRGKLVRDARADLVIVPAGRSLAAITRRQLRMVMVGGSMRYGDAGLAARMPQHADCSPVVLDGAEKVLDRTLVEELASAAWREPGLQLMNVNRRVA